MVPPPPIDPSAPLEVERTPLGLRLRGTQLHLEPRGRSELGFLAHARGARPTLPARIVATAPTVALLEAAQPRSLRKSAPLPAAYRMPFALGALRLTVFPAGHVLGSAQLRCELEGNTIVYSGDLGGAGPHAPRCAEPREQLTCDTLILRASYGHPRYRFPPRAEVLARLLAFVERALAEKITPVVLAAPLGGAQEAVRFLGEAGHRLRLHPAIHRAARVYEKLGVPFQDMELFEGTPAAGEVVVLPYSNRRERRTGLGAHRTVLLSGRAIEEDVPARAGVDEALPLSDHADFAQLVEYAQRSNATRVLTVHGFSDVLAQELRALHLDAHSIDSEKQLVFPGI